VVSILLTMLSRRAFVVRMKALGIFTWVVLSYLVSSLLTTFALGKLWVWFVAAEYGPGPSMGAWFGISNILGLVLLFHSRGNSDASETEGMMSHTIMRWVICGLGLAFSWCLGSAFGWVH
jgi:hypothetical protein